MGTVCRLPRRHRHLPFRWVSVLCLSVFLRSNRHETLVRCQDTTGILVRPEGVLVS